MSDESAEVTALLHLANAGDSAAGSELFRQVHQQLHLMAERKLRQENSGGTIQATVLVHDAFLQLVGAEQEIDLNDRKHFFVLAATAMRRILIDRARARRALKRGGPDRRRADLTVDHVAERMPDEDLLNLHTALKDLAELDAQQAKIVELRYFGGYTIEETAELLDVTASSVKQEFAVAKAWLFRQLKQSE